MGGGQIHVCAICMRMRTYIRARGAGRPGNPHSARAVEIGLRPEICSRTVSHEREDDPDPVHFPPAVQRRRVSVALRTAQLHYFCYVIITAHLFMFYIGLSAPTATWY